jgi:hypothetical protein
MKTFQKKLVTELVDEYVKKHWEDILFLKLLNELTVYGVKNTDRVMAFGIALIHDMDATKKIFNKEEENKIEKMSGLPEFKRNNNGVISITSNLSKGNNFDNRKRKPTFDYNIEDNDI